jgi:hypothetical protein
VNYDEYNLVEEKNGQGSGKNIREMKWKEKEGKQDIRAKIWNYSWINNSNWCTFKFFPRLWEMNHCKATIEKMYKEK